MTLKEKALTGSEITLRLSGGHYLHSTKWVLLQDAEAEIEKLQKELHQAASVFEKNNAHTYAVINEKDKEIQKLQKEITLLQKERDKAIYEGLLLMKMVKAAKTKTLSIIKDFELVKFKAHERSDEQTEFISATIIRNLCDLLEVFGEE